MKTFFAALAERNAATAPVICGLKDWSICQFLSMRDKRPYLKDIGPLDGPALEQLNL